MHVKNIKKNAIQLLDFQNLRVGLDSPSTFSFQGFPLFFFFHSRVSGRQNLLFITVAAL